MQALSINFTLCFNSHSAPHHVRFEAQCSPIGKIGWLHVASGTHKKQKNSKLIRMKYRTDS